MRSYLLHLGVQTLAHFNPPVGHKHRPVHLHVHQSCTLVQKLNSEANSVLGGQHRNAALLVPVPHVVLLHALLALPELRGRQRRVPTLARVAPRQFLPVVRLVALVVQHRLPDLLRRKVHLVGHALQDHLRNHHALRSPKPAERSVGRQVGFTHLPAHVEVGNEVRVVHVRHRAAEHARGQVGGCAPVRIQVHVNGGDGAG